MNHRTVMSQLIIIKIASQVLHCYENDVLSHRYSVSTGKNGAGEQMGSERTPRGWHQIDSIIGLENEINSVFVARVWTGEIYTDKLAQKFPERDWILTRILRLDGMELGRNKGGQVDSLERYIYIHGTPDCTPLGIPGSHGCIRMRNIDVISLANWAKIGTRVYIE